MPRLCAFGNWIASDLPVRLNGLSDYSRRFEAQLCREGCLSLQRRPIVWGPFRALSESVYVLAVALFFLESVHVFLGLLCGLGAHFFDDLV